MTAQLCSGLLAIACLEAQLGWGRWPVCAKHELRGKRDSHVSKLCDSAVRADAVRVGEALFGRRSRVGSVSNASWTSGFTDDYALNRRPNPDARTACRWIAARTSASEPTTRTRCLARVTAV